jgi:hypothetical protein
MTWPPTLTAPLSPATLQDIPMCNCWCNTTAVDEQASTFYNFSAVGYTPDSESPGFSMCRNPDIWNTKLQPNMLKIDADMPSLLYNTPAWAMYDWGISPWTSPFGQCASGICQTSSAQGSQGLINLYKSYKRSEGRFLPAVHQVFHRSYPQPQVGASLFVTSHASHPSSAPLLGRHCSPPRSRYGLISITLVLVREAVSTFGYQLVLPT